MMTISEFPESMNKKMTLLKYFRDYMRDNLQDVSNPASYLTRLRSSRIASLGTCRLEPADMYIQLWPCLC